MLERMLGPTDWPFEATNADGFTLVFSHPKEAKVFGKPGMFGQVRNDSNKPIGMCDVVFVMIDDKGDVFAMGDVNIIDVEPGGIRAFKFPLDIMTGNTKATSGRFELRACH